MDAQTLFRDGITALRDKHDPTEARKLLTQSLKLDPKNEMAWLWLSRTTDDPQKQLQCLERALKVNPSNVQALTARARLLIATQPVTNVDWRTQLETSNVATVTAPPIIQEPAPKPPVVETPAAPLSAPSRSDKARIKDMLIEADALLAENDVEGALEQWVNVLEIQVDHPTAMQNAVRYLFKLHYEADAHELIWRALDAGTTSVPIYLTAIDLARYQEEHDVADELREHVALMPNADDDVVLKMIDHFIEHGEPRRAVDLLERAIATRPPSQKLLLRMGELHDKALGRKSDAMLYYERAARLKSSSKEGKSAEKVLRNFTPVMTDRERGSMGLALREALGFGAFYLLLGWQDAGLNFANMGAMRWLGVGLSVLGGYLIVTAFSSPQQSPLAKWLGGRVPERVEKKQTFAEKERVSYQEEALPTSGAVQEETHLPIIPAGLRALIAVAGVIVLLGAFVLVFSMSLHLLQNPVQPFVPSVNDLLTETAP